MSRWTHVTGCLYIETHLERKDIVEHIKSIIEIAPKITGSEQDADIFVNALSGYNTSTSCDCEHCEYGKTRVFEKKGNFTCDADSNYKCPDGEYQTQIAITLVGDLRDRNASTTCKELTEFIQHLQTIYNFDIDYYSVLVDDDCEGEYRLDIQYDEDDVFDKGEIQWISIR